MRLSSSSLAGSEIRPGSCARATNLWGRSVRLLQALCLLVIPEAFAAPMVVALCAHWLAVADILTGQHVTTSVMVSRPFSLTPQKPQYNAKVRELSEGISDFLYPPVKI